MANDRGDSRTLYPHVKCKDKHRIENYVAHRADNHGNHSVFGTAVGADHGVDGRRNHHKWQAKADDKAILQCIGPEHIGGAEEGENGIDPHEKDSRQHDAHDYHQADGVAHAFFRGRLVALAQL